MAVGIGSKHIRQMAPKVFLSLVCVLMGSCRKNLPVGPSDVTAGIVIYEFNNYQGESAHVTQDISDLDDVRGPCTRLSNDVWVDTWDDCISSARIAPGWEVQLYEHPNFGGLAPDRNRGRA